MGMRKVEEIQADIQEAEEIVKTAAREMSEAASRKRQAEADVRSLKDEMIDVLFGSVKKPQK